MSRSFLVPRRTFLLMRSGSGSGSGSRQSSAQKTRSSSDAAGSPGPGGDAGGAGPASGTSPTGAADSYRGAADPGLAGRTRPGAAALRERKAQAANNLAGATWEQSISQEMAAVAQRHGGDIAVRQEEVGVMRDQLRALGQSPRRMPAPVL